MSPGSQPDRVIAAVRAFTIPKGPPKRPGKRPSQEGRARAHGWPDLVLLIDTETSVDTAQRLRFGSYRLCQWVRDGAGPWQPECIEEGLFYGDELPGHSPQDFKALRAYVRTAFADTRDPGAARLPLYSRRAFVEQVLWRAVSQGRALICGFNLPFDLSRLAVGWGEARPRDAARRFARGFSFQLWDWKSPETRRWEEHPYRPRLLIRHENSKRARFAWGACRDASMIDNKGRRYPGHFLELKTFAFALTGESHSLASAAKAFEVKLEKSDADYAGAITPAYIDYNRQDLRLSQRLLEALRAEFDRHPIDADPWQLRSQASVAKAYLRAAGITPLRTRAKAVPDWVLGAAMEAYYGGRTECHLRGTVAPVVYTDVSSMYPTVHTLARLSEWLTAGSLDAKECTVEAGRVLDAVTASSCLRPDVWSDLRFFALVEPADDVLPLRAQYDLGDNFTIGVNRVTSRRPMWYTGFDLATSVLFTGRVPKIRKAVTIRAEGKADTLRPVQLRGQVKLDPLTGDIFRAIVEARARAQREPGLTATERTRLRSALKVIANSGSYGIFAEMNPQDLQDGARRDVRVIGGSERFTTSSSKPEQAGEYFFPPVAALVTGAARLLLALIERLVRDAGGTYAMCDTDSLAIIASETGGFLPCPGGPATGPNGGPGVRVLSWKEVRDIVGRIDALKPYGPVVSEPLLKIEVENFKDRKQVPLWFFGLSAKRYCLFREGSDCPDIVKASEHGLGHLLNPNDPADEQRGPSDAPKWIEEVWRSLILAQRGEVTPAAPSWFSRPAVARHGFTSPALIRPLHRTQKNRPCCEQVKPFNFALTSYVAMDGAPEGTDQANCHLVAPFERDPRKWEQQDWHDTNSGTACRITTRVPTSSHIAGVKSVADVVAEYAVHADSKSAGPTGESGDAHTVGLLQRRHVEPIYLYRIGKESNRYEEVERGEIRELEEVQEVFENPHRTAWDGVCVPALRSTSLRQLAEETGIAESLLARYRQELVKPREGQMRRLILRLRR